MNNLVVVESPTKARTLQRFLGDQYQIEASMGHVRDLPKSELGVDIEHDFLPQYIIPRAKIKQINQPKKNPKKTKKLLSIKKESCDFGKSLTCPIEASIWY